MMEVPQNIFSRGPCFFEEVLMIQEAPKAQKMLKNKSSQNWMKPIPLRLAHRADSENIFTFSNRHCMRELSHSGHFLKQAKGQQSN